MRVTSDAELQAAADALVRARKAVALTGAGISVESGVPDFRSPGGLWSVFEPMEYATLTCFLHDPEKAWRLYRALGETLEGKTFNPAHAALADLEERGLLAGVITLEDVLEEILGQQIVDEVDAVQDMRELARQRRRQILEEEGRDERRIRKRIRLLFVWIIAYIYSLSRTFEAA